MTEQEYLNHAEQLLTNIELNCDIINENTDADIDAQRSGGVITLVFKNSTQIIINMQKPLFEIWLAAKAGGFHYRLQDGCWYDTKSGNDFYADLSTFASAQAGLELTFSAAVA